MRHALLPALLILSASAAFAAGIPPVPAPLDFPLPKLLPAGGDFPVTDFGAVPDGKTLNTAAIQKAIDACSAAGGGTVVIPRTDHGGVYMSGAIFLKKGANLRIEKDAVLKAWLDPAQYPIIDTRFEGTERPFMSAFLNATNLDGITVSGEGTIDGSGDQWLNVITKGPRAGRAARPGSILPVSTPPPAPIPEVIAPTPPVQMQFTAPRTVLTPTPDNPPPLQLVTAGSNRPRLVLFCNCTNTAIKDLHLQNQAVWCLHILYCADFLVDNVTILDPTHTIPSSDGIDIDSSRRVRVNKTTISVNDDCISIKSGKDADGRRVNRACEDVLIVNSHMAEGQGGVAMGSEVSGTIRNVEVRDTLIDSGNWAPIRFKSQDTRGGTVENVVYRNLKIANVRQVFDFNLNWTATSRSGPRMPTSVKNIYIINLSGAATGGGSILGLPDSPVANILFQDCDLTCGTPVRIVNTANLDTAGLKITLPNRGPAFTSTNSTPGTQAPPNLPETQTQP
jgi:polygalacturonase